MADLVTSQTIQDGAKVAILKFTNVSDGTGEAAVVKVDVSALGSDPLTGKACTAVVVSRIQFVTYKMDVKIEFDATTNTLIAYLPENYSDDLDYRDFSGIPNNAGSGKTGDIVFTTTGAASGDAYSIVMTVNKTYG
tara:strand:- start:994 stop:1401 length:408 start_codon:yes stop_codon:yes gene_type:complete